jgi:hypothetical protein
MFEVGSMVLCTRHFLSEDFYPKIIYPQLGEYYWIRDVVFYHNSQLLGLRFHEIKNELFETDDGYPEEPTFIVDNFIMILKPLPPLDVNRIIKKSMKSK